MTQFEPLGFHLRAAMAQLGWSQADLAHALGWGPQMVSEVVRGDRTINPQQAMEIAAALGNEARDWLRIQSDFLLHVAAEDPQFRQKLDEISARSELDRLLPVRELTKRGVLPSGDVEEQRSAALRFLETDDLTTPLSFPFSARRQDPRRSPTREQVAWVACAREAARQGHIAEFNRGALLHLATSLSRIAVSPTDFRQLPQMFADVGVRLVYVEAFPGGKIEGAAMHVDDKKVIALSGRGGRLDRVLFSLAHEAAHIWLDTTDSLNLCASDAEGDDDQVRQVESAADLQAAEWLLPDGLPEFPGTYFTRQRVEAVAHQLHVSPSLVIGRLQRDGLVPWNSALNKIIPSVKEEIRDWS